MFFWATKEIKSKHHKTKTLIIFVTVYPLNHAQSITKICKVIKLSLSLEYPYSQTYQLRFVLNIPRNGRVRLSPQAYTKNSPQLSDQDSLPNKSSQNRRTEEHFLSSFTLGFTLHWIFRREMGKLGLVPNIPKFTLL